MELTDFHGPPASAPQVPGFDARTLLGFGAHGEVWLAEDLSTGVGVALKVGRRAGTDPTVSQSARASGPSGPRLGPAAQEVAVLARIRHPHIVRLHQVVPLADDGVALVLDLAAGGSLAALIAARGPIEPGEVSTLLIPLAGALGHLHGRGVVHGDISPGNVLFTGDGRPQLGDLGVARVLGTRGAGTWSTPGFTDPALARPSGAPVDPRSADLWALAAVGWFALTGRPPDPAPAALPGRARELSSVLIECLAADPAARPDLDELAQRAWQAAPPAPIRLISEPNRLGAGAGLPPLSGRVTRRLAVSDAAAEPLPAPGATVRSKTRRLRRVLAGVLAAVGLAVLAVIGLALTGSAQILGLGGAAVPNSTADATAGPSDGPTGSARPSTAAATSTAGQDRELTRALTEIGRDRAAAFASLSTAALARADGPDSPAMRSDLALVQRLRERGYHLEGVTYQVSGVEVLRRRGDSLDVRAVVTTSGHRQVQTATRTSVLVPQDGPRPVVFTVVAAAQGSSGARRWHVQSVSAAS